MGPACYHEPVDRLPILKALGDNTRYAIYLEVARSPSPRSTAEIADVLVDSQGLVGRPQHRYTVAADAPSLGLEPPAFPLLARMLGMVAAASGAEPEECAEVGRAQGRT